MAERSNYGYAASNVVDRIVVINKPSATDISGGQVGKILWKIHDFALFDTIITVYTKDI